MRRLKGWVLVGLLALAVIVGLAAASLPYLPVIHGTTDDEVEQLGAWLRIEPGMRLADLGAGDGSFAIALARRVGPEGHVYAIEIDSERLAEIRQAVKEAGLENVSVVEGAISSTNLPEACCEAVFSRLVYHHLTDAPAINADIYRALRPGGRLLVIDLEPGGILDLFGDPSNRHGGHGAPAPTVLAEVTDAGFETVRGPERWRGSLYALMVRRP